MSTELTLAPEVITTLVLNGDMRKLSPEQKVAYYNYRCQQAGLDPSAKPFDLLTLNGKEILYANAGCTQQLCATRKLSVAITAREKIEDILVVSARVTGADGRSTENTGAVSIAGQRGETLANAMMKATTKATRRTVLAHCGLGMLDESEAASIPGAHIAPSVDAPAAPLVGFQQADPETGETIPLYAPHQEAPYLHRATPALWIEAYGELVRRIATSDRFTPEDKQSKIKALADCNKDVTAKFGDDELTNLKMAVAKAGGSLDPKEGTSQPTHAPPHSDGESSTT